VFLMLTKGKVVKAETLRCAQSDEDFTHDFLLLYK